MSESEPFHTDKQDSVRRQEYRRALEQWWERLAGHAAAWDLEAVKHLIVLNAAGFAGMATILAGSRKISPAWVGPTSLLGYGFGVVFAILNIYLASVSFIRMTEEIKERIALTWDARADMSTAPLFSKIKRGRRINIAGQVCGWLSAILAIASTCTLGYGII
uniref:Transmembrane protein n=1 Tax=Ralstonia solanacearum TaxID=305 RepID=A0A0S4V2V3_RALSL|nr:conserved membrane protein of unknown function [Ralstonia solanacearum]